MKKTVSLIFAIIISLAMTVSMTSCLALVDRFLPDGVGSSGDTGTGSSGSEDGALDGEGSGSQNSSTSGDSGSGDGSGNTGEGSGEGSGDTGNTGGGEGSGNGEGSGEGGTDTEGTLPLPGYSGDYLPDSEENAALADKLTGIERSLLSTVVIISNFEVTSDYDYSYTYPDSSAGSGVIYKLDRESGDAIIITNFHVVYDKDSITWNKVANDIEVYLYGQEYSDYKIPATFIGGSLTEDLAVLKIEDSDVIKNSCAQEVIIGDSDLVSVYDKVFAVGNPEGDGMAATDGMVSVDSESLSMTGADGVTSLNLRVMRVSAAINPGNSGGGLYDESGKLIGIVNAKKTGSEVDNIAWAIPINLAKNIVDNILYYADGIYTTTGYRVLLGVTVTSLVTGARIDPDTGRLYKAEMVVISDIVETSFLVNPEDGTSPLQANDIINAITVDGVRHEVYRIHHVIDHMYTARAGSTVTVNITRGDSTFDVTVTVPTPTEDSDFQLTELR